MEPERVLNPPVTVLIALASLIIHYEEFNSEYGRPMDMVIIREMRSRPELQEWFEGMDKMAFLPMKRN